MLIVAADLREERRRGDAAGSALKMQTLKKSRSDRAIETGTVSGGGRGRAKRTRSVSEGVARGGNAEIRKTERGASIVMSLFTSKRSLLMVSINSIHSI